jgi:hypothetical protein
MYGGKPPTHSPLHLHGKKFNEAEIMTFNPSKESHYTVIQNNLKTFWFLDPIFQHCRQ